MGSVTGPELIDMIITFPSLDVVLDRDPHARPYTDQELEHLVQGERGRRALYQAKTEKAAAKRQGVEDPTPSLPDGDGLGSILED